MSATATHVLWCDVSRRTERLIYIERHVVNVRHAGWFRGTGQTVAAATPRGRQGPGGLAGGATRLQCSTRAGLRCPDEAGVGIPSACKRPSSIWAWSLVVVGKRGQGPGTRTRGKVRDGRGRPG